MEEKKYLSENTDNIYYEYNKMNNNNKIIFNKEITNFQNIFSKKEIRTRSLSQYKSFLNTISNNNFNTSLSRIKNIDYFIQILTNSNYYYDVTNINKHLSSMKMVGFRRVKGDGNCFYRSIIYSIIEDLVLNSKKEEFLYFIYDIHNKIRSEVFDIFIKSNELSYNKNYKDNIIELIYLIYEILSEIITVDASLNLINSINNNENESKSNIKFKTLLCLDLLYLAFNSLPYFDLFLIGFTKIKIMTYMKRNEKCLFSSDFEVIIGNLLPSQYENNNGDHMFDDFYNDFLIKLNKEAEKVIIYLTPYVFNVNLNVFIVEPSKVIVELFETHLKINTSLNTIPDLMLLYYSFHYEVVYINGINSHILLDDYINKTHISKSPKDNIIDSELIDNITNHLFNKNIFDYNKILNRINKSKYTNEDFNNIFTLADYSNTSNSFPFPLVEDVNDELIQIQNNENSENFMKNELFLKYLYLIHFSKSNLILNKEQSTLITIKDKFINGKFLLFNNNKNFLILIILEVKAEKRKVLIMI